MKRLLRTGWIRAGVPPSSIESLADHSWSVAFLTYSFSILENNLRGSEQPFLDVEKAVLIALLHDLNESEYFDMDKSVEKVVDHELLTQFQQQLEVGAIRNILAKVPIPLRESLETLLNDHQSEEYHLARVSDLVDLLYQAKEYRKRHWIDEDQFQSFRTHSLQQLKKYEKQFSFLPEYLKGLMF